MSKGTLATLALSRLKISFDLFPYDYDPNAPRVGLQAAQALGRSPHEIFKTLMVEVDGKPACAVLAADDELSMKKVAAALKGKSAVMMKPPLAERLTGFKVGGISPFGQKKKVPTLFDESLLQHDSVLINGGQRGLLVGLKPQDALLATDGVCLSITTESA